MARTPRPVQRVFGDSGGVGAIVFIILLLMCMLLVRPVIMSLMSWQRTAGLLAERRLEVRELEARHRKLQARLAYYRTDTFVAERARQYGLVREGEVPFVMRELVHPELIGTYARTQLANATMAPQQMNAERPPRDATSSHVPAARQASEEPVARR